jgi:hypothetical protein
MRNQSFITYTLRLHTHRNTNARNNRLASTSRLGHLHNLNNTTQLLHPLLGRIGKVEGSGCVHSLTH